MAVQRALKMVRAVVVVVDAFTEMHFAEREIDRMLSSWWDGVERRERRRFHRAELQVIDDLLARTRVPARRRSVTAVVPPSGERDDTRRAA